MCRVSCVIVKCHVSCVVQPNKLAMPNLPRAEQPIARSHLILLPSSSINHHPKQQQQQHPNLSVSLPIRKSKTQKPVEEKHQKDENENSQHAQTHSPSL